MQHGVGSFALPESVCLAVLMSVVLELRLIAFPVVVLLGLFVVVLVRRVLVFVEVELSCFDDSWCGIVGVSTC